MQVITSNLLGQQSPREFFRKFPAIHVVQYQCSPMSSSDAIQRQYEMACRYQAHAHDTLTCLLLDEVGLAEHSPDMPLKVLHSILVHPPIAIIGLSNWALDPAKMNRAVCIRRTEPSPLDIELTAASIVRTHPAPAAAAAARLPRRRALCRRCRCRCGASRAPTAG